MHVQYLGGPSVLIEIGGVRILTDPTFDPRSAYPIGARVLTKTEGAGARAGRARTGRRRPALARPASG